MICEHVLSKLAIKILEVDRELGDRFIWLLCNCVELAEQFPLGYLPMEKAEEMIADVLKSCREYQCVAGPSRDKVNFAILEDLASATVKCCIEWSACRVDTKDLMCDSASVPLIYR